MSLSLQGVFKNIQGSRKFVNSYEVACKVLLVMVLEFTQTVRMWNMWKNFQIVLTFGEAHFSTLGLTKIDILWIQRL